MTIKRKAPDGKATVKCVSLSVTQKPDVFLAQFMSDDDSAQVVLQISDTTKFTVGESYDLTVA